MRLVTRLTGLSADTIRAWERRYGAIEPVRSAGNTRRFSAEEVRRLVLLRDATSKGHAISSIAKLSIEALEQLSGESPESPALPPESQLASDRGIAELRGDYRRAVERFDARRALDVLMRAASFLDHRELLFGLVVPLVQGFETEWTSGGLMAQEQMVVSQLRSLVSTLLRYAPPRADAPQILLSTPAGHRREMRVLVAALLAASRGLDPLYLGPELPREELVWAVRMSQAQVVLLALSKEVSAEEHRSMAARIEKPGRGVEVWVLGVPSGALGHRADSAKSFYDFDGLDDAFDGLLGGQRPAIPNFSKR